MTLSIYPPKYTTVHNSILRYGPFTIFTRRIFPSKIILSVSVCIYNNNTKNVLFPSCLLLFPLVISHKFPLIILAILTYILISFIS